MNSDMDPEARTASQRLAMPPARIALAYVGCAGLWIIASGVLLEKMVDDPALLPLLETIKGLMFVCVTGALLYLLLARGRANFAETGQVVAPDRAALDAFDFKRLLAAFFVLALVSPLAGLVFFKLSAPQEEREAYANLQAVSRLKSQQIENWLNERQGDAKILADDRDLAQRVASLRANRRDREARVRLLTTFEALRTHYGYDNILLVDVSGKVLLKTGIDDHDMLATLQQLEQARPGDAVIRSNLYLDPVGHTHIDWMVPVMQGETRIATIVLHATAEQFLFPLLAAWPVPTESAETLLVRRQGDALLFLNAPRNGVRNPLKTTAPLEAADLPTAIALRQGGAGITKGNDYLGVPVLAAYRPVAGTDWAIVTKIDQAEVLLPLRRFALWISMITFASTIALGIALLFLWRQQQRVHALALLAQKAEADRLLRLFFDLPFIGMAISSPTTRRWVHFNDHLCTLLGYTREELAEKLWTEVIHPDDLEESLAHFNRVLRGKSEGYGLARRYLRKDGEVVYAQVDVKCVRKADGSVDHFVTMVQDITGRKRAEEASREHEQHYSSLFENMLNGFADCRMVYAAPDQPVDFILLHVNQAFVQITGIEGAAGKRVSEVVPGIHEQSPELLEIYGRVAAGGAPESFEYDFKAQAKWLTISAYSLKRGEFAVTFEDITERKHAERELRIAATAFETQESIIVTDADNIILRVNQAFTRLTGYRAEEVIGRQPSLLKSDRQDAQFYRDMWHSLAENHSWHGEIWNRYKNGEAHPGWLNITAVTDDQGRVSHYIATYYDITLYKEADEKIRQLAFYDPLTHLPNRRLLLDRLQQALVSSGRHQHYGAILFIDLDNFKTLNDTRGHSMGDLLLVEVARRVLACVRGEDTVARLGGDEFVVMLSELSEDIQKAAAQTEMIAEQILASASQPYQLQGYQHFCTASIGISLFQGDNIPVEELLKRADTAMYEAKNAGRATLRFYDPAMQAELEARSSLENDLRLALERNEFLLHFQPQADTVNGRIVGAEALLRWQHPQRGLVPPLAFIPLAEESGLIVPIGTWVLEAACRQASRWAELGHAELRVAVNISPRQFWHKDFVATLSRILGETGMPVQMLELEITETMMMHDFSGVVDILRQLKAMGVRFSIDDFGTGYSSLNYLKSLPIGILKIDRSFVKDLTTNPDDAAIVKAIITMAHSLRLRVIAEGVETEGQLALLEQYRCDEIQGYLFSRPLPAEDFTGQLLADRRLQLPGNREQAERRTLLLVDDEDNVRSSLLRLLRGQGYRILAADSGEKGLELLATNDVGVIITDQRMPGMTGVEFLRRVKLLYPQTVRMILSGYTELSSVTEAINEGAAYKFLTKPWEDDQLRDHIVEAFSRYEMKRENARLQDELGSANTELSRMNEELHRLLDDKAREIHLNQNTLLVMQEILANLGNAVIGIDESGLVSFVNQRAEELFGRGRQGSLLGSLAHERLPQAISQSLGSAPGSITLSLEDGTEVEVRTSVMGEQSRSRGVVVEIVIERDAVRFV